MKRVLFPLATIAAALCTLSAPASAAPWQSINQRQVNLQSRIDQGVRSGALTRAEARDLRTRFATLNRLEASYRRSRPGLTARERTDLDRRFDQLSRSIRVQQNDRQQRR